MAAHQMLLSPAELAYLHSSLSLKPPVRPDGRTATQFRPLSAETGILPGANGSARVCLADGTEAMVGVKAEVEPTATAADNADDNYDEKNDTNRQACPSSSRPDWLQLTVEMAGLRDDDPTTVFLAEMLREALLADGELPGRLLINRRFHWRLYLDVLLISPPLSYPLPLLSLTTHLALLATRLPRLTSEGDEDPMFDDDWEASTFLYPRRDRPATAAWRPPVSLLVVAVGSNVIFDPAREELAVADSALAVSVAEAASGPGPDGRRRLRLLAVRTVDPPSRLTPPGAPSGTSAGPPPRGPQGEPEHGLWQAPVGGTKFAVLDGMIQAVLEKGGVADEVLDGLEAVQLS